MPRPSSSPVNINHEDHQKPKTSEYFISLARLIALLWIFPDVNKAGFDEILIVFSSLRIKIDIRESLMDVPYY